MNIDIMNYLFQRMNTEHRLHWLFLNFDIDDILVTSSFGNFSCAFLKLISTLKPKVNITFIDTGYHFEETWHYIEKLKSDFNLNMNVIGNDEQRFNEYQNPHDCCRRNKVQVLKQALSSKKIWVNGIHADQTHQRQNQDFLSWYDDTTLKFNPILDWTYEDITSYIEERDLPHHPLSAMNYQSIGCKPCTKPSCSSIRDGRWSNFQKSECGLHHITITKEVLYEADSNKI